MNFELHVDGQCDLVTITLVLDGLRYSVQRSASEIFGTDRGLEDTIGVMTPVMAEALRSSTRFQALDYQHAMRCEAGERN